jgi:adenosylcobinamide-phosphate synthase
VAGVGGLLGYRAVNTLDAMVGHRDMRYERFGWAAARLDDVANLVPARLTAVLAAALAPAVGGSGRAALRTVRRDGAAHPSPNAGRCEAAFAGALGVSLGGTNVYQGRPERRGTLGDGPPPGAADLDRAIRLSRLITVATTIAAAAAAYLLSRPGSERGPLPPERTRPAAPTRVCHGWRNHNILLSWLAHPSQTRTSAGARKGILAAGMAARKGAGRP